MLVMLLGFGQFCAVLVVEVAGLMLGSRSKLVTLSLRNLPVSVSLLDVEGNTLVHGVAHFLALCGIVGLQLLGKSSCILIARSSL